MNDILLYLISPNFLMLFLDSASSCHGCLSHWQPRVSRSSYVQLVQYTCPFRMPGITMNLDAQLGVAPPILYFSILIFFFFFTIRTPYIHGFLASSLLFLIFFFSFCPFRVSALRIFHIFQGVLPSVIYWTYNHRPVLVSTTTTTITFTQLPCTIISFLSSPNTAYSYHFVISFMGVPLPVFPCIYFTFSIHFWVDFYFLIFHFSTASFVFYGGALTCTSRSLSPSVSTLSVVGVCWTRCPCPTFVRRIAVSHALYLPNTITHHVSLYPIDHFRVSSPLST